LAFVGLLFFWFLLAFWPLSDLLASRSLSVFLAFVGLFGLYQPLWHVWFYPAVDKVKLISTFTKQSMQPLLAFNSHFGLCWPLLVFSGLNWP
jgi:hypothetical protein